MKIHLTNASLILEKSTWPKQLKEYNTSLLQQLVKVGSLYTKCCKLKIISSIICFPKVTLITAILMLNFVSVLKNNHYLLFLQHLILYFVIAVLELDQIPGDSLYCSRFVWRRFIGLCHVWCNPLLLASWATNNWSA